MGEDELSAKENGLGVALKEGDCDFFGSSYNVGAEGGLCFGVVAASLHITYVATCV